MEPPMHFDEFLQRWHNHPATQRQIVLLTRIAAALQESRDCVGAVLVGSFAKEKADRLSDLDLVVFCPKGAGHSVFRTIKQQIAPADALFTVDGTRGPDSPFQKLIFDDFTSIEFHVIAPETELTLEQPFVEIVNRDGYLDSRTSPRFAPNAHDMAVYHYGDRSLAWELLNCMKWIWRGDYATAKRYLIKLGKAIEASETNG
jgi:predicted nucleotidyltransferase